MTGEFSDQELLSGLEMLQVPGALLAADEDYKSFLALTYKENQAYLSQKDDSSPLRKFLAAFNPILKQRLGEAGVNVENMSIHEIQSIRAKIVQLGSKPPGNN